MMTISNLDFLHYMTAVSHEMSDEPVLFLAYVENKKYPRGDFEISTEISV